MDISETVQIQPQLVWVKNINMYLTTHRPCVPLKVMVQHCSVMLQRSLLFIFRAPKEFLLCENWLSRERHMQTDLSLLRNQACNGWPQASLSVCDRAEWQVKSSGWRWYIYLPVEVTCCYKMIDCTIHKQIRRTRANMHKCRNIFHLIWWSICKMLYCS